MSVTSKTLWRTKPSPIILKPFDYTFTPFPIPPIFNFTSKFNFPLHKIMNFPTSSQQSIPNSPSILHKFFNSIATHLNSHLPNFSSTISTPPFATIPQLTHQNPSIKTTRNVGRRVAMSNEDIEGRLAGVFVYALSNSNEEFVVVSGIKPKKSLGLFCFMKEDADSLLNQMKLVDPNMRRGSSVVPVALNKVFQLKVNGVAFRLIPEASQIKNALKEKEKAGTSEEEILGVPVFQSRSLTLKADNRTYRPVFFRKEDLEKSLFRASKNKQKLNPVIRQGDIEVAVLEDIVKGMKDESSTKWNNVVFIPPGFDVPTDVSPNRESAVQ